jgi:hypothetical protein
LCFFALRLREGLEILHYDRSRYESDEQNISVGKVEGERYHYADENEILC